MIKSSMEDITTNKNYLSH